MSINLFLARHGNTFEANQTPVIVGKKSDVPLVAKGKEQARELALHFNKRSIKFDAIFSGKLKRQIEYAQILNEQLEHKAKITVTDALDEIDYGAWEGLSTASLTQNNEAKYEAWTKRGTWPEHFGETESTKTELLLNWLNCIRSQYEDGQHILAITSNGIIRQFTKFSDLSCGETLWSRLADNSSVEQLKVNTGAYCEVYVNSLGLNIDLKNWNIGPGK